MEGKIIEAISHVRNKNKQRVTKERIFTSITKTSKSINQGKLMEAFEFKKAATRGALYEKVLLEILQNSQENNCARISFFPEFLNLRPATLLKKRLWHRCFPVNFTKFLRTPFLQSTSGRLLLNL